MVTELHPTGPSWDRTYPHPTAHVLHLPLVYKLKNHQRNKNLKLQQRLIGPHQVPKNKFNPRVKNAETK